MTDDVPVTDSRLTVLAYLTGRESVFGLKSVVHHTCMQSIMS